MLKKVLSRTWTIPLALSLLVSVPGDKFVAFLGDVVAADIAQHLWSSNISIVFGAKLGKCIDKYVNINIVGAWLLKNYFFSYFFSYCKPDYSILRD